MSLVVRISLNTFLCRGKSGSKEPQRGVRVPAGVSGEPVFVNTLKMRNVSHQTSSKPRKRSMCNSKQSATHYPNVRRGTDCYGPKLNTRTLLTFDARAASNYRHQGVIRATMVTSQSLRLHRQALRRSDRTKQPTFIVKIMPQQKSFWVRVLLQLKLGATCLDMSA